MIKLSDLPDLRIDTALWRGLDPLPGPKGDKGDSGESVKGDPGKDGTNGSGFVWHGPWRATATYGPLDCVSYDGSSYVCTSPSHNNRPHSTSRVWALLAARGEAGRDGRDGAAGQRGRSVRIETDGNKAAAFFDSAAVRGNAVFVSSANHVDLASGSGLYTGNAVGLASAATPQGGYGEYVTAGPFRNDAWSWTAGEAVYLSASVPGGLTHTPADPGEVVTYIGRATSPTEIVIEIERGVELTPEV